VVDNVKIFLTSDLITMQNLVIVTHTPKNFGDAGAPIPVMERV